MSQTATTLVPRHWRAWQHPLFWKMLGADLLLIGFTAIAFPARTGERLVLMIAAIVLVSLVLNVALTPSALRPLHVARGTAQRLAAGLANASLERPVAAGAVQPIDDLLNDVATRIEADRARALTLIRRSLHAHEAEREAIARELRDAGAQQLAALTLQLTAAVQENQDPKVALPLAAAKDLAVQAANEISALAERIAPGLRGEFGLAAGLDGLRRRVTRHSALDFTLDVRGAPFPLPLPLTRALLRVAEEAVENVECHAGARSVTVDLSFTSPIVRLEISDDANGFDLAVLDQAHGGLGLFRARELLAHEGGKMQIESAPGCGTRVLATVDASHGATS